MTAGRKRKFCHRERNGQPKRPSKAERESFQKRVEEAEMQTALRNPDRSQFPGRERDQRCESSLGRFFMAYPRLRFELYDAAKDYARLKRRWRAFNGVPSDITGGPGSPGSKTPSDATVRSWERQIAAIELAVARDAPLGLGPMQWLAVEEREIPRGSHFAVMKAMMATAVAMGRLSERDHPWG